MASVFWKNSKTIRCPVSAKDRRLGQVDHAGQVVVDGLAEHLHGIAGKVIVGRDAHFAHVVEAPGQIDAVADAGSDPGALAPGGRRRVLHVGRAQSPEMLSIFVPAEAGVPNLENQAAPFSMMRAAEHSVSTLLTTVGQPR